MSRLLPTAAVAAAVIAATSVLGASGPVFWTVAAPAELLKGTSNGVIVGLDGAMTAGPQATARLTTTPAQVWSLAAASDGTLWAGTGGDGRLIRLRPGQAEETVFTAEEKNIFAIATSGSRVYFATGPEGKIYVIDGTAAPRVFFDPSEKYVWALAVDRGGRLWVGAGNPAIVYRIDQNGTSQTVYKPSAAHVVSLALDSQDRVLAGTESPGRLYRFETGDRPFVVLDSGLTQLAAIAVSPAGVIYAAAIAKGDESSSSGGESASVAIATAPPPTPGASASSSAGGRKSVVFRIDSSGTYETFWETSDVIYDLAASGDAGVIAASGPEGRLFRIDRNRQVQLLGGVDAKQVTRLVGAARGGDMPVALATANPGRVVAIGTATQSPASYMSPVRDTKSVSLWGLIRWESTGNVQLFTRSGNTETPDDSWSDWGGPYSRAGGEAIKSPAARFVQWKAVLTQGGSPAPRLTSVTVAYLPRNSRPAVSSVTTYPPGVVFQKPFSSEDGAIAGLDDATADARRPPGDPGPIPPAPGRRMFQKGLQTIAWKADDADSDHLAYSLQYRREGEATWHDLRTGLSDQIFVWDTTSVADGRYIIKILASDSPSNAADRALVGERESDPIEVDNTPPVITTEILRQGGGVRLGVHVRDARSAIQKVEYSIGGGPWQLIAPVDGLGDSPDERYEIPMANEGEAARMMIRATDALGNVAAQTASIR